MQNNNELQREADEAVRVLKEGGIILYPTDTVWGLGCDATNAEAVERIYKLKRSENKKSMLVLCASADMVVRYVNRAPGIAFEVMELATSPLTAILPGAVGVAGNLIPEEGTLGVRIPDHAFCQRMLRKLFQGSSYLKQTCFVCSVYRSHICHGRLPFGNRPCLVKDNSINPVCSF